VSVVDLFYAVLNTAVLNLALRAALDGTTLSWVRLDFAVAEGRIFSQQIRMPVYSNPVHCR
jgi:hypothetical protein